MMKIKNPDIVNILEVASILKSLKIYKVWLREEKQPSFFVFLSFLIHCLVFGSLLVFTGFHSAKPVERVIRVDLLSHGSLSEPVRQSNKGRQRQTKAKSNQTKNKEKSTADSATVNKQDNKSQAVSLKKQEAEIKAKPEIKPDISLKPKPKNLKDLIANQEKEDKKRKEAEKRKKITAQEAARKKAELEKKQEEENKRRLADSLELLKIKERLRINAAGQTKAGQGDSTGSGDNASALPGNSRMAPYQKEIALIIQENWVFNDILAGIDRNTKVQILIKILKNGKIKDVRYESHSGSQYLDESAKRAIIKADPLPPLPYGMDSYDIGFIFTPQGVL